MGAGRAGRRAPTSGRQEASKQSGGGGGEGMGHSLWEELAVYMVAFLMRWYNGFIVKHT